METIPESLNGELPPLPSGSSHGSRGHTYNHNGHNQNLHVPKRSNTFTASTSTSQTKHQRYAGAESQTQERPSSSLSRSFTSPLSSPSPSDSGSRMIGGGKSTQRVREWVKRSNSSRESKTKTSGRSSSNSGHQTLEIIHLGGGRVEHESNSHVHSSSLSSNFLAPTSQQTRASVANSIDSRVTQWSDLYHDPPESLTVITKPATATGKPPRPVSPELHERPQLRELGLGGIGSGYNGGRDHEVEGQGHQSRHRHTKSDGSIHPAPLRVPSNSSSSSFSADKKEGQGGAAVATRPEETWKPQGLTRSNSKWKPLPVPPPPGAPGSVTPLVSDGGRRAEDNINMTGAIGVSPLTSSVESESEFGEREDTPPRERQQGAPHIVNVMVQRSGSRSRTRDMPLSPPTTSSSNDVSLGIGYAVGLGVLSPPLTPPQMEAAESGSGGIRESIWPVPPSYSLSLSQSGQFSANAPSRSATAPPPEKQRQHQQKPSTSSSLASSASASALASSQSAPPTHVIPKRSDSLSYSRSTRRPPQQHAPQLSKSSSSSSLRGSTEKTGPGHSAFTDFDLATATTTTATAAPTPPLQQHKLQTPTVTPPTPIVQVPLPRGTTPTPTPTTPIWSPRNYLSSRELLWLHRNYRGITSFMAAWGLSKGLTDEAEREEGLGIMRALIAAEVSSSSSSSSARIETAPGQPEDEDGDEHRDGGEKKGGGGGGDNSWLDFSPGPGPGAAERNINMKADVDVDGKGNEKENEGRASPNGANGYAALKGQGVRMKPRGAGGDASKEGRHGTWRKVVDGNVEDEEGSDFF
ncbi:hypothetical protein B0H65DRAFT_420589 [Neurospora tetraspora]|uniref:Uncharacterized protein n=1 Tax=Neurospora tetraspora TaxID=94610 RepID=A0AAE0JIX7_9PEZI|nr:hypothetical protein B0H65DRAFT_420589 [Neurospora tetraspora]